MQTTEASITFSDEGQKVYGAAQPDGCPPFTLVSISDLDWNHDMAPWDSPAALKKGVALHQRGRRLPAAAGGGDHTQGRERVPWASDMAWDRRVLSGRAVRPVRHLPDRCVLTGRVYVRILVVSRFQGIRLFPRTETPAGLHLFLFGDKEAKTRNPVLKTVQENTEEIWAFYQSKGIDTVFQLNPGNHFVQGIERTVAGIQWLLSR